MNSKPKILILSGSLRYKSTSYIIGNSINKKITDWATTADVLLYKNVPIFNEDLEGNKKPSVIVEMEKLIGSSDGVIICSPEYNSSIPGGLKNILDWLSRPHAHGKFREKVVSVIIHTPLPAGGYGAYSDLIRVLSHMGNHVHFNIKARVSGFREPDGMLLKTWCNDLDMVIEDYYLFFKKIKKQYYG